MKLNEASRKFASSALNISPMPFSVAKSARKKYVCCSTPAALETSASAVFAYA